MTVIQITELRGCILGNHTWTSNVNAAKLTSSQTFQISDIPVQGFFEQETTEMLLEGLLAEPQLQFQVWCRQRSVTAKKSANSVRSESTTISSCLLDLIIYGPESLFTIVGDYLNDHESYLQNPQMCDRNILYRNPHTLAGLSSASPLTTWQLHGGDQIEDTEGVTIEDHSLDHFTTEECLDEATQPQALSTQLKKHQKQALTFMLRRETGWRMDDTCPDIWESRKGVFMNRITGRAQTDRPSDFQGGIVSDPMGLGKTLSMLSLIAMDLEIEACTQQSNGKTLVVVPSALLGGWEEQITEHVRIGTLRQTFHHGRSKLRHGSDLSICGVIITTYETIRQEWSGQACHYSPLFATEWHRIVLDEAHIIRNSKSQTSQAVCALRARSRWAMTGTPIQNKLDELSALLHFLRAEPYSQNLAFQSDIVDPWKRGDLKNGLPRLHCLLQCLMLRRPKTIIDLPPRKDLKLPLEFTPAERAFYQGYLDDTKQRVREALSNPVTANGSYFNALQRIDALRRICNTGCHFQKLSVSTHRTSNYAQGDTSQSWISDTLEYLLELENTCCRMCNVTIGGTQGPLFTSKSSPWLRVSKCMALTCTSCVNGLNAIKGAGCDHVPACEYATINPEIRAISQRKSSSISSNTTLPSKVSALITHLQGTVTRAKRFVP
jgi:SNF2 family DNA or RNA helicase